MATHLDHAAEQPCSGTSCLPPVRPAGKGSIKHHLPHRCWPAASLLVTAPGAPAQRCRALYTTVQHCDTLPGTDKLPRSRWPLQECWCLFYGRRVGMMATPPGLSSILCAGGGQCRGQEGDPGRIQQDDNAPSTDQQHSVCRKEVADAEVRQLTQDGFSMMTPPAALRCACPCRRWRMQRPGR